MRIVEQVRQHPVERRRRQAKARPGRELGAHGGRVRGHRAVSARDPLARLVDRHGLAAVGVAVREHEELVDDVRHRIDVAHDAVAQPRVVHHLRAQPHPRERRAQIVRDAREHHRAVVLRARHLLNHLIEAVRELAQLARPALGQRRHRHPAAEARDRARERTERLLQLPGGEERRHHRGREDHHQPEHHPVERARRPQRLNRHDDPVAIARLLDPQHGRMARPADAHLRAGRQALAQIVREALERGRQILLRLGHVAAARRDEPHPRRQRLVGRALRVLAHRVDEERRLLDRIARLELIALEPDREVPREVRQQQHADDKEREPPEQRINGFAHEPRRSARTRSRARAPSG